VKIQGGSQELAVMAKFLIKDNPLGIGTNLSELSFLPLTYHHSQFLIFLHTVHSTHSLPFFYS